MRTASTHIHQRSEGKKMATKILRKLTIKEAVGGKAELLKIAQTGKENPEATTGKPVEILMILGQVTGFLPGEGDNGPFLKLKGEFEATNLITGEVISDVGTAILPNFVADVIANALKTEGTQAVDFGIKLSVEYDETAATMYKFQAESLMPTQPSRAVSSIRARLEQAGIALPKPAQLALPPADPTPVDPTPAPAPAETKPKGKK